MSETRPAGWLARRLSRERADGLYLTLTLVLAICFLWGFVSIAYRTVAGGELALLGPAISSAVFEMRTPLASRVFWLATLLGNGRVVAALAAVSAGLLALWGRRSGAVLVAVTVAAGAGVLSALKLAFERTRPALHAALIAQPGSYSFPSGHAFSSLVLAGVVTFVLWRSVRGARSRAVLVGVGATLAATVGISRVYLGVHWPSDVVASWSLALAWLSATCGTYALLARYGSVRELWEPLGSQRMRVALALLAAVAVVAALVAAAFSDPLLA